MTKEKHDNRWGRWHILQNALYVVLGLVVIVLVLLNRLHVGLGATIVLACLAIGIALDIRRFRTYRCPDCGELLPPPPRWWMARIRPERISFLCRKCDVVWKTNWWMSEMD